MLGRLINLTPPNILIVKGPALVRCENDVTVLGKNLNDEVTVRAGKILPFETSSSSKVKIRIKQGGSYRIVKDGKVGVSVWKDVVTHIDKKPKRVMLVGATDTGKSTLTTYLSNIAYANGWKVGIIDGDVGQGDLAPPGCIGASLIGNQFLDLRDVDADHYAFIGSISPMGIEDFVIDRIKQLLDKLDAKCDTCMINTDGYVDEHGIDYKIALARTIKPDLVVCIGNILEKFDEFEVVHVNAPSRIAKTRAEREERRLAQYARFLDNGKRVFEIKEKNFAFMDKVYGHDIFNDDLIRIQGTLLPSDILKGMFVGIGIGSDVRGFGIITRIASGKITLKTSYEEEFDTVMLSTIGISKGMRSEYHIPLVTNR